MTAREQAAHDQWGSAKRTTERRGSAQSRAGDGRAVKGRAAKDPQRQPRTGSAVPSRRADPVRGAGSGRRPSGQAAQKSAGKHKAAGKRRVPFTSRPILPVTLGFLWGVLLLGALQLGTAVTALVLLPVGIIGGVSAVKAVASEAAAPAKSGKGKKRPAGKSDRDGRKSAASRVKAPAALASVGPTGVAVAAPVLMGLAALLGPAPAIAVAIIIVGVGWLVIIGAAGLRGRPLATGVAALAPAIAIMSVVLARGQGDDYAEALIGAVLAYDLAAFVMGHTRTATGGPVGIVSGIVSIAVVGLFTAAAMDPPFSGSRPWILFGAVAVLAPLGVYLTERAVGGSRLPALRRIDSFILAAPVWALGVALVVHP